MKEIMKEMVGGCCVCSDERGWPDNPLVYCDGNGCTVAVHQACYGIIAVPTGPWYCRKCESPETKGKVRCELCPSKSGALKRSDTGGWAHVVCALYIPEVRFGNVTSMEPIVLRLIPPERFNKTCYICQDMGKTHRANAGACMQCNKSGCKQQFHVTCAQSLGLLCEEAGNYLDNVKYCGYCQHHYSKLKKGGNVKTIPPYKPVSHDSQSDDSSEREDEASPATDGATPTHVAKAKGPGRKTSHSGGAASGKSTPNSAKNPNSSTQPMDKKKPSPSRRGSSAGDGGTGSKSHTPAPSPQPYPENTVPGPAPKAPGGSTPTGKIPLPSASPSQVVKPPETGGVISSVASATASIVSVPLMQTTSTTTSVVQTVTSKTMYQESVITNAEALSMDIKQTKKRKAVAASNMAMQAAEFVATTPPTTATETNVHSGNTTWEQSSGQGVSETTVEEKVIKKAKTDATDAAAAPAHFASLSPAPPPPPPPPAFSPASQPSPRHPPSPMPGPSGLNQVSNIRSPSQPQGKERDAPPSLLVSVPLPPIGPGLNLCLPACARSPVRSPAPSPANASTRSPGHVAVRSPGPPPVRSPSHASALSPGNSSVPANVTAHPQGKDRDAPPPLHVSGPLPSIGQGLNLCLPASASSPARSPMPSPAHASPGLAGHWSGVSPVHASAPATITAYPQGKDRDAPPPLHVSGPLPSIGQGLNLCLPASASSPARSPMPSPAHASSGLAGHWSGVSPVHASAPATITAYPQHMSGPLPSIGQGLNLCLPASASSPARSPTPSPAHASSGLVGYWSGVSPVHASAPATITAYPQGLNLCLPGSARSPARSLAPSPAHASSGFASHWSMASPVYASAPATITAYLQGEERDAPPPLHVSGPLPPIGQSLNLCLPGSARSPARSLAPSPAHASSGFASHWSMASPVYASAPATITAYPQGKERDTPPSLLVSVPLPQTGHGLSLCVPGPASSPARSPAHAIVRSPAHASARSPAHASARSPAHASARSPAHGPARSPAHVTARSPAHASARSPAHGPARSPAHVTARSPAHASARSPAHGPARSPAHATARSPAHATARSPAHASAPSPAHASASATATTHPQMALPPELSGLSPHIFHQPHKQAAVDPSHSPHSVGSRGVWGGLNVAYEFQDVNKPGVSGMAGTSKDANVGTSIGSMPAAMRNKKRAAMAASVVSMNTPPPILSTATHSLASVRRQPQPTPPALYPEAIKESPPSSPSSERPLKPKVERIGSNCTAAPHMLGNELNLDSGAAARLQEQLTAELAAHAANTAAQDMLVPPPLINKAGPSAFTSTGRSTSSAQSLDQLLERQWEQGSQFLMEQAQHFDIASLLSCLHQLRTENVRLEEHVGNLLQRRDHLLAVNARLAIPLTTVMAGPGEPSRIPRENGGQLRAPPTPVRTETITSDRPQLIMREAGSGAKGGPS